MLETTQIKNLKIDELQPGMYVNNVIEQTGEFKIKTQGIVSSDTAIKQLAHKGVISVSVDFSKSQLRDAPEAAETEGDTQTTIELAEKGSQPESTPRVKPQPSKFDDEIEQASVLMKQAKQAQQQFLDQLNSDQKVETEEIENICDDLFQSIERNKNALSCLTRMQNKGGYLLSHSMNMAILMGIFANHLELPEDEIQQLVLGAMLLDVGKIAIKNEILNKNSFLNDDEFSHVKQHVELGYNLLKKSESITEIILDVVANHHERLDGSGYPEGKNAAQLSKYAKMAAIVDSYDAMISDRPHKRAMKPVDAYKELKHHTGTLFDAELVNSFINCMGIHPVGSLVKMESGLLGLVISLNENSPVSPIVKAFYDVERKCHIQPKTIDLSKSGCLEKIKKSMHPDDFNFNTLRLFQQVLFG